MHKQEVVDNRKKHWSHHSETLSNCQLFYGYFKCLSVYFSVWSLDTRSVYVYSILYYVSLIHHIVLLFSFSLNLLADKICHCFGIFLSVCISGISPGIDCVC